MIKLCADIMGGNAVQLQQGRTLMIDAGSPFPIAERFAVVSEIAVVDLNAAMGRGDNTEVIRKLVERYPCSVGGGIRTLETARFWLNAGARSVVMGTAARPEILRELPRERVVAAIDARDGEVVDHGWTQATGITVEQKIAELKDVAGTFLFTLVESEGMLGGIDLERARHLIELARPAKVIIAGGVTTCQEIATLDRMGADAQVGMAIYSGKITVADAFMAPLVTDRPDGLIPTVVCNEYGEVLGLVYSSRESLKEAIETRTGVYYSRSRKEIWRKGLTSGNVQELLRIEVDCDRDALKFIVRQKGSGFCHTGTQSCFGDPYTLASLEQILQRRLNLLTPGSYTHRLFDNPDLLGSKILEEARELAEALRDKGDYDQIWEAADILYFIMAGLVANGVTLQDVIHELERRHGAQRNDRSDPQKSEEALARRRAKEGSHS